MPEEVVPHTMIAEGRSDAYILNYEPTVAALQKRRVDVRSPAARRPKEVDPLGEALIAVKSNTSRPEISDVAAPVHLLPDPRVSFYLWHHVRCCGR